MSLLTISEITLRIAGRELLRGASLSVEAGRKIGIVGRNGTGKSTLFRAIAGELAVDAGEIRLARAARLGVVAQHAPDGPESVIATVLAADAERAALLAALETAAPERQAELFDRLAAIGADAAEARAATILAGLGFTEAEIRGPVGNLSGGWRMRVALAAALSLRPDLLLLDEPTNHLDLEAALWLEGWLRKFPGAILLISHDRGLLDRVPDAIAHLDNAKLTLWQGGYSAFARQRAERAAHAAAAMAKYQRERQHLQNFVDRFRSKASKARQAQSKLKAIARLTPPEAWEADDAAQTIDLPPPAGLAPPLLAAERAAVGYGGRRVLDGLDFRIDPEDRIALLGRNGNGKSTLARLLAGKLPPMAGELRRAPKLAVGYFAQHQEEELDQAATPLAHMRAALPLALPEKCRAQLARFGLDAARAETEVRKHSGGERARLLLALATREAPQLLILDEPTNHLDIPAREALVRALADFPGAVLLISHDAELVDAVAEDFWLVADGRVTPFDGDLDEYRAWLASRRDEAQGRSVQAAPRANDRRARADARAATAPLRRQLREAEQAIEQLTRERAAIEAKLADQALYASGKADEITRLNTRLAAVHAEIHASEEAWLAASAALEEAASA
jgi:ATP-binding cassette subfamily F protein 3